MFSAFSKISVISQELMTSARAFASKCTGNKKAKCKRPKCPNSCAARPKKTPCTAAAIKKQAADKPPLPGKAPMKGPLYRKLTLACLVGVLGLTAMVFMNIGEHERPEFIPYDYMRVRNKRFPWGEGQRSYFHNPHLNPLKDGYED